MKNERLLLVDDDPVFRERLAKALIARGHQVETTGDGQVAMRLAEGGGWTGIVVDLKLGATSGLDIMKAILERQPDCPVIVLTGFGSIATALEAVRLGARDYLTKPADPGQILAALHSGPGRPMDAQRDRIAAGSEPASLDRVEWEHIQRVLVETGNNITRTARLLGIDRRSLQRKLAKYPPRR
jgi:two-component system response regulator RegA